MSGTGRTLGELLQLNHGLSDAELGEGLRLQATERRRIGSMLIALGYADPDVVANALAEQKGVPAARRRHFDNVDPRTLELVPKHVAAVHRAIPLGIVKRDKKELIVAMRDPDNQAAVAEIGFFAGMSVRPAVAPELVIDRYLDEHYGAGPAAAAQPAVDPAVGSSAPRLEPPPQPEPEPEPDPAPEPEATRTPAPAPQPSLGVPRATVVVASSPWEQLLAFIRPWTALILLVAGSAAFVLLARSIDRADLGGAKPVEVEGFYHCAHVGASVVFPAGWTYLPKEDQTERQVGTTARGSFFYNGGSPDQPNEALALAVLDTGGRIPDQLSERDFEKLFRGFKGAVRAQGALQMRMHECEVTELRGYATGECVGSATYKEVERELIAFLWVESGGFLVVAAFITIESIDDIYDDIAELVTSIEVD